MLLALLLLALMALLTSTAAAAAKMESGTDMLGQEVSYEDDVFRPVTAGTAAAAAAMAAAGRFTL
jgi:hypothetical protein